MKSHRQSRQSRFVLESLEGRLALSGMGGLHHQGDQVAEVHGGRNGANNKAGHDLVDDKDGNQHRHGADDGANHNARSVQAHREHGKVEHPAGHK